MKFVLSNLFVLLLLCSISAKGSCNDTIPTTNNKYLLMDMVQDNPGEKTTVSAFNNPMFLKSFGYKAKVFFLFDAAQFGINWQHFDKSIFPDSSAGGKWVRQKFNVISQKYNAIKAAKLDVYCMLDMLVLPTALVKKYKKEICNNDGKIDVSKPFTQKCIVFLINQMFEKFPQLDGIIVRTGETYLQDAPYYVGNSPVIHGLNDHVMLLNLLRKEVCVKWNKKLIYRTWDFGQLHSLPKDYLMVTNQILPHPNLYFSIKHTIVDFWRGAPQKNRIDYNQLNQYWINEATQYGVGFNPCLGIGKHKQIVEVQCQREYEGKGSSPDYVANGVINGFEELKKANAPEPYCLNQLKSNPLFAGVWTWSRGGGWGGPYIKNEFWCELNAFVMAKWTQNTNLNETEIFREFALRNGLPANEIEVFHQLCLLSAQAVMEGQYSRFGNVNVVWTRDNHFGGLSQLKGTFDKIIVAKKVKAYLQEKDDAIRIWKEIENIAYSIHFKNEQLNHFIRVSCTYGRIKYQIINDGWHMMLYYLVDKENGELNARNEAVLLKYLKDYDAAWTAWQQLAFTNTDCPSLYEKKGDSQFLDYAIEMIRNEIAK